MAKPMFVDGGSRSAFFAIDDKRGFKTFPSYEDAEYAHGVQFALSQHDLAPRLYSGVKRMTVGGRREWGFESEIAEMLACGGNDCCCGKCEDIYDSKIRTIKNLCKKIEEIGYKFVDNHIGNVGYIKRSGRRKLVCIDTGSESVNGGDGDYLDDDYDEGCSCSACKGV